MSLLLAHEDFPVHIFHWFCSDWCCQVVIKQWEKSYLLKNVNFSHDMEGSHFTKLLLWGASGRGKRSAGELWNKGAAGCNSKRCLYMGKYFNCEIFVHQSPSNHEISLKKPLGLSVNLPLGIPVSITVNGEDNKLESSVQFWAGMNPSFHEVIVFKKVKQDLYSGLTTTKTWFNPSLTRDVVPAVLKWCQDMLTSSISW